MNKRLAYNILLWVLVAASLGMILWRVSQPAAAAGSGYSGSIELPDLNTIYLPASGVEVHFSEVLLSDHEETRKLTVSTQDATVSTELEKRIWEILDIPSFTKTQTITYTGTGYFMVDLSNLSERSFDQNKEAKTLTIYIPHAKLEAIEIDPEKIIIDSVKESLFAKGNIKLTAQDFNDIEIELRNKLTAKFNTVYNGQQADKIALKMVREIYAPLINAIDSRYTLNVEFAN